MAKSRNTEQVRLAGVMRRPRRALMVTTALQATVALVLALPARAQLAANAQPTGGVVVAGSASITQTPNATNIDQSSQRAALNWQSFNVGSRQSVNFHQPNASAVALNRVVGPDPSQIAGQINANGQVILENQDGITFSKGAQVNTAGFVATTSGITDKNFMAGHMVFDQPGKPGASVVNEGHITVRQAGIAALVAPQVANSGVITAQLGRVVLAGATRYTLDLYGDGLVSIDVTGSVKQVPVGPGGATATALVTNSGTILAAGGRIALTARAAAGLVQELVAAGGKIAAPTAGAQTGQIVLNGIGGSIVIAGQLDATGAGAGEHGGAIQVSPAGGVVLASTARVDASGRAGGGTVAIGTDLARAAGGPKVTPAVLSHDVTVSRGAVIAADATGRGNGGRITVLSSDSTVMDGAISARGGAAGGNGGFVEVSGRTLGFDGQVNVGAPAGSLGTVLFDPGTLTIQSTAGNLDTTLTSSGTIAFTTDGTVNADTVSNTAIDGLTGNILLQATTLLSVQAPITLTKLHQGLTMQSGGNLEVLAGASITTQGNISLSAATAGSPTVYAAGSITLGANITTTSGTLALSAGTGGIALGGVTLNAPTVDFTTTGGGVSQLAGGAIDAGTVLSSGNIAGGATLSGLNTIAALGSVTVTGGNFTLSDDGETGTLTVNGPVSAPNISITGAGSLLVAGAIVPGTQAYLGAVGAGGVAIGGAGSVGATGALISVRADSFSVASGGTLVGGTLELAPNAGGGVVTLGTTGSGLSLTSLTGIGPTALRIGAVTPVGGSQLTIAGSIAVNGAFGGAGVNLELDANGPVTEGTGGTLTAGTLTGLVTGGGSVNLSQTSNAIAALGGFTVTAGDLLLNTGSGGLNLAGPVSANRISVTAGQITETGNVTPTIQALLHATRPGGINLGAGGTLGATGALVGLEADAIALSGGTIRAATLEVAPNTPGATVSLGSGPSSLSLDTLLNAGETLLRIGGVTPVGASVTPIAGSIAVTGAFGTSAVNLELDATGPVTEGAGGTLTAGTLNGLVTNGGSVVLGGSNAIGTLGNFTVTNGDLTLLQAGSLSVAGPVSANDVMLTAGTLGVTGDITATAAGGTIALAGTAGALGLSAGALLNGPTITLNGGASVVNIGSLATVNAGTLLGLGGAGVSENAAGVVSAPTLVSLGTIAGAVDLAGAGNAIQQVSGFTLASGAGAFALTDGGPVTLAGPVTADSIDVNAGAIAVTGLLAGTGTGAQTSVTLNAGAGGISFGTGAVLAAGGLPHLLDLSTTGGGISEAPGAILVAAVLQSSNGIHGNVVLDNSHNTIAQISHVTVTAGNFTVVDVAGQTLGVPGTISDALGTIGLAADAFDFTGGSIVAADVALAPVDPTTVVTLGSAASGFVLPGTLLSGSTFNTARIDIGSVNGGGSITAAAITINAGITLPATTLGLYSLGTIVETGAGALTLGGLSGVADGGLGLLGSNTIGALAGFVVGSGTNFDLADSANSITVGGSVSAANFTITDPIGTVAVTGTIVANSITIDPTSIDVSGTMSSPSLIALDALTGGITLESTSALLTPTGSVELTTTGGGVTQASGGVISAGTLFSAGSVWGTVDLAGANTIASIGSFAVSSGDFVLADNGETGALLLPGTLVANNVTLGAPGTIDLNGGTIALNGGTLVALNAGAGGITLGAAALVNAGSGGTLALGTTGGGVTEAGTGTILAGTLISAAAVTGTADLVGSNTLATLGGFTVNGGDFTLISTGSLAATGPVSATNVSITTGTLDVSGAITAGSGSGNTLALTTNAGTLGLDNGAVLSGATIALNGGGFAVNIGSVAVVDAATLLELGGAGVNEIAGGTIIAGTLAGLNTLTAGVSLLGSNTIAALGGITLSAGNFLLADGGEQAGTLTVAGTLLAPASGGATIALGLGSALPGAIDVVSGGAVDVTRSSGGIAVLDAGTLGIAMTGSAFVGGFSLNTVDLSAAAGGVSEQPSARIAASYLQSSGGVTGTVDLAGLTNALPQINGFVVTGGNLIVVDQGSQALTVAGSVAATGGTIDVTADGLFLTSTGSLVANSVAVIPSSAAGNPMTVVGVEPGALSLGTFVVNGQIAAGRIDLGSLDGGASAPAASAISIAGGISVPAATLGLYAVGGIAETAGGSLTAAVLTGQAGGPVSLGNANSIGTLGAFAVSGAGNGFALNDTAALTVAGSVAAPGQVYLEDSAAGGVTLAATGVIAGGTLDSVQADAFTILAGGTITGAAFELAPNTIGSLVTLGGSGGLSLASLAGIGPGTVRIGAVTSPTAGTLTTTAGSIEVGGAFGTSSINLALDSNGGIGQTALLTAGTLSGNAHGAVDLGLSNSIGTLAGFIANGFTLDDGIALTVNGPVSGGPSATILDSALLSVPGTIGATAISLSGTSLAIGGLVTDGGAGTTTLVATGGSITEAGTLIVGTLSGSSSGATSLTGATTTTNQVATLAGFTANGFTLDDGMALTVNGPVTGGPSATILDSALLSVPGTIGATAISLSGTSLAIGGLVTDGGTGTTALVATGGSITEAGTLIVGTLSGSSSGTTSLTGATTTTNQIATLAGFTANGFTLDDGMALTVNGPVSGGPSATILDSALLSVPGSVNATAISLTGSNLAIGGLVTDGGTGTTALVATGGSITEAGTLIVGTLSGSSSGAASLTGASPTTNQIATLAGFTANGFTLDDGMALTVNGPVTGGPSATILDSALLSVPGTIGATAISLSGTSLAIGGLVTDGGAGTTTLVATGGSITEAGTLIVGTLSGSSSGATSLTGATTTTNQVATLAGFTANGFTLDDGMALTVNGPVTGGPSATILDSALLSVPGTIGATAISLSGTNLAIGGLVTDGGAGTTALVATGGSITEAGTLIVGTLSGSSSGATSLTGASPTTNQVVTLNGFTANGFTFRDGEALTIGGTVNGTASAAITDSAGITVAGEVTAGTVLLQGTDLTIGGTVSDGGTGTTTLVATTGTIYETGSVDAGLLTGSSGGATTLLGANRIAGLGTFNATAIDMKDNVALTLSGTITAPLIQIDAGTNQIGIASGTTLVTSGIARPNGAFVAPTPGDGGAYLTDFVQQGNAYVVSPTAGPTILDITANPGGSIAFDPAGGLHGPNTWLILNVPGGTSGFASGNTFVQSLDVVFSPGSSGGGASLYGTVNGIGGQAAAGAGHITPQADARFRMNTCAIGSVNCVVLPVEVLPLSNPLEEFSLGSLMNTNDEGDLFLPIVSDRDY